LPGGKKLNPLRDNRPAEFSMNNENLALRYSAEIDRVRNMHDSEEWNDQEAVRSQLLILEGIGYTSDIPEVRTLLEINREARDRIREYNQKVATILGGHRMPAE